MCAPPDSPEPVRQSSRTRRLCRYRQRALHAFRDAVTEAACRQRSPGVLLGAPAHGTSIARTCGHLLRFARLGDITGSIKRTHSAHVDCKRTCVLTGTRKKIRACRGVGLTDSPPCPHCPFRRFLCPRCPGRNHSCAYHLLLSASVTEQGETCRLFATALQVVEHPVLAVFGAADRLRLKNVERR